jgi:hypothetical protein
MIESPGFSVPSDHLSASGERLPGLLSGLHLKATLLKRPIVFRSRPRCRGCISGPARVPWPGISSNEEGAVKSVVLDSCSGEST